jgi:hypothetical protein
MIDVGNTREHEPVGQFAVGAVCFPLCPLLGHFSQIQMICHHGARERYSRPKYDLETEVCTLRKGVRCLPAAPNGGRGCKMTLKTLFLLLMFFTSVPNWARIKSSIFPVNVIGVVQRTPKILVLPRLHFVVEPYRDLYGDGKPVNCSKLFVHFFGHIESRVYAIRIAGYERKFLRGGDKGASAFGFDHFKSQGQFSRINNIERNRYFFTSACPFANSGHPSLNANPLPSGERELAFRDLELPQNSKDRSEASSSDYQSGNNIGFKPSFGLWRGLDSVSYACRIILIVAGLGFGTLLMAWAIFCGTWRQQLMGVIAGLILFNIGGNVLVDWLLRM